MDLERRGIERVPSAERGDRAVLGNLTLWLSANTAISSVSLGSLAVPVFHLGLWDSVGVILLFNLCAALPVAFFSTLGPRLGLRQMTLARYSFGWGGAVAMALFNVVACVGWSAVNVIVGASLLAALAGVPVVLGIVVLSALTAVVGIYGYDLVHRYERWAWLPMAALFIALGAASLGSVSFPPPHPLDRAGLAAALGFGGAVFGFCAGWMPYAADYNVNQPEDTPPARVFALTLAGLLLPLLLLEALGVALTLVPALAGRTGGDLLAAAVGPLGRIGPPVGTVLALSVIANNIPNDYSLGLSMQVVGGAFARVPRHVWTLIGTVVYVALAIPAASAFAETLTDFLLLLGYWLGPWAAILLTEHFVFRARARPAIPAGYDVDAWNDATRLPRGWAALVAMVCGLCGALLGAAQAGWTGPIARLAGGGDVGFELALAVATAAYLPLRVLERRRDGR